jgi:deoxycytidylate deaminase
LACAKKIAQAGVRAVVYAEEYAMGHLTAALLSEAGVQLRRLSHGPAPSLVHASHARAADDPALDDSFSRAL